MNNTEDIIEGLKIFKNWSHDLIIQTNKISVSVHKLIGIYGEQKQKLLDLNWKYSQGLWYYKID